MSDPVHIRSLHPLLDAAIVGLYIEPSRTSAQARSALLRSRFDGLAAEALRAAHPIDRDVLIEDLLVLTRWAVQAIEDSLSSLAGMRDKPALRDRLLRGVTDEFYALAELSTADGLGEDGWRFALWALHAHTNEMISGADESPAAIGTDVLLERLDRAEHIALDALHAYLDHDPALD